jgi:hypothetical protein
MSDHHELADSVVAEWSTIPGSALDRYFKQNGLIKGGAKDISLEFLGAHLVSLKLQILREKNLGMQRELRRR